MGNFTRFLIRHKFASVNIIFAVLAASIPPTLFKAQLANPNFFHILGIVLFASIFLEIGATHYKASFIYASDELREAAIPWWLSISFLLRIVVSFIVITLVTKGLGWLRASDFVLILLVGYAMAFEFWVRASLLNPEYGEKNKVNIFRVWLGEFFHMVYLLSVYFCLWCLLLLDSQMIQTKMTYTQNYPILAGLFLLFFITLQLPNVVEEYFRPKGNRGRISGMISFVFPVATFIFHVVLTAIAQDSNG